MQVENSLVQNKGEFKPDDPPVKKAFEELAKNETPEALLERGRLQELVGNMPEALKLYKEGQDKFKDPKYQKRFLAGMTRVETSPNFVVASPPGEPEKPKEQEPPRPPEKKEPEKPKEPEQPKEPEKKEPEKPKEPEKKEPEAPKEPEKKEPEKPKEPEQPKQPEEKKEPAKQPEGMSFRPGTPAETALLALLLVGLQNPPAPEPEEAGFDFWEAARLAKQQKYDEAIKLLDKAKEQHKQRRIIRLRKQQNPDSDPNEEIFLRTCDELKIAWTLLDRLRRGGYLNLADKRDPTKAIDELVKDMLDARLANAALGKKLVDGGVIQKPEDLDKGLDKLLADRKNDADKITGLEAKLGDLGKKLVTAKVVDKPEDLDGGIDKLVLERKNDADKIAGLEKKSADQDRDLKTKDDMLGRVQQALFDDGWVKDKDNRTVLVRGMREALDQARVKDPDRRLRDLSNQVVALETRMKQEVGDLTEKLKSETTRLNDLRLKEVNAIQDKLVKEIDRINKERLNDTVNLRKELNQRRPVTEMLSVWVPILERGDREQSQRAVADVQFVLGDMTARPEFKAQAKTVLGLALRNIDKFAEARMALTESLAELPADARDWRTTAQMTLKEVSDPAGYFITQAGEHRNRRETQQARALLDRGIKALGDNNAAVLAERSLFLVDLAKLRSRDGKAAVGDPDLNQALKDAEDAVRKTMKLMDQPALQAAACYALGRVQEELDLNADALENYTRAVMLHNKPDSARSRYLLARARMLVQPRPGRPPLPPPPQQGAKAKEADKVGRLPTLEELRQLSANPQTEQQALTALLVLMTVSFQPPEPFQPGKAEALKLADEIIKQAEMDPKSVPFDVLAGAYMLRGLQTRALMSYAEGLKGHMRADYYEGLMNLLRNHPQIRRPESLNQPNPGEADIQYGRGLRYYFSRDYRQAEQHFKAATEYFSQDARFFYFLGLSRLKQGKVEAAEDFEVGAKLERQNMPHSQAVSIALERVQGRERKVLNEARFGQK